MQVRRSNHLLSLLYVDQFQEKLEQTQYEEFAQLWGYDEGYGISAIHGEGCLQRGIRILGEIIVQEGREEAEWMKKYLMKGLLIEAGLEL